MDGDDPSIDQEIIGETGLNGDALTETIAPSTDPTLESLLRNRASLDTASTAESNIIHTRPSSSSSSVAVAQLEQTAQNQSQAEVAIQQHISTTMKSLYRLTRGAGIERSEFHRLVQNELDTLGLMEDD